VHMYHTQREKLMARLHEKEGAIKALEEEKMMTEVHIQKLQSMVSRLAEQCQTSGTRSGDSLMDSDFVGAEDEPGSPPPQQHQHQSSGHDSPEVDAVVHAELPPIEFWLMNCPRCSGMVSDL
jgi:hypothetical protein